MTFSEQFTYALFYPSKHKELIKLKKSRFVAFVIVLMLAISIVGFAIPIASYISSLGGLTDLFGKKIGKIEYTDERLVAETGFSTSFNGMHFVLNTDEDEVPDNHLRKDGVYISFGATTVKATIVSGDSKTNYSLIEYKDFLPEGFNNEDLCNMVPSMYAYLVIAFIFECISNFISYALIALLLSWMVKGALKRMDLAIRGEGLFRLCMYSQALGIVISNFNQAIGLAPAFFGSMVAVMITLSFLTTAIVSMKGGNKL